MKGCMVIHSDKIPENGLNDFYSLLFSDTQVFSGNMFNDKFSVGTVSTIPCETGAFSITDDTFYEMPVPSRGSMIMTCFDGNIGNKRKIDEFTGIDESKYIDAGFYPSKLMVRLNSNKHNDAYSKKEEESNTNYASMVKERLVDKLEGNWAMTMAYITLSGRSRILVARKNRDIYFHLVYTKHFYALIWTDEVEVFNSLDNRFFIYSMTPLYDKELLIIHPLYVIDKWKKWRQRYKASSGLLASVSALENYLKRISR